MAVILENRLRQMLVLNLAHETFCEGRTCSCTETGIFIADQHPRTGERTVRQVAKRIPASLTLLAGERRSALPNAVLTVPEVKLAIERGHLRLVEHTPEVAEKPAPPVKGA